MHLACAADFVKVNYQALCLLTPPILVTVSSDNTSFTYNRPYFVLERNQILLHFVSTGMHQQPCYAFSIVNRVYLTWYDAFLYSSVACIPVHIHRGSLNMAYCTSSWTIYIMNVYYIRYTEPVAHRPPMSPVGLFLLAQNAKGHYLHLLYFNPSKHKRM